MFKKASVSSARSGGIAGGSAAVVKKDILPSKCVSLASKGPDQHLIFRLIFFQDDPKTWTEDHVGKWLENNGFAKYRKNFQDQSIAGNASSDDVNANTSLMRPTPKLCDGKGKKLTSVQ